MKSRKVNYPSVIILYVKDNMLASIGYVAEAAGNLYLLFYQQIMITIIINLFAKLDGENRCLGPGIS